MIPETLFVDLLKRLLDKSKKNQVNWTQKGQSVSCVVLTKSYVSLAYVSPSTASDYFQASLHQLDTSRTRLAVLEVEPTDDNWNLMMDLHSEATRHLLKWDQIVAEFEEALNSDKVVGESELPSLPEVGVRVVRILTELAAWNEASSLDRYGGRPRDTAVKRGLITPVGKQFEITGSGLEVLRAFTQRTATSELPSVSKHVLVLLGALLAENRPLPLGAYKEDFQEAKEMVKKLDLAAFDGKNFHLTLKGVLGLFQVRRKSPVGT